MFKTFLQIASASLFLSITSQFSAVAAQTEEFPPVKLRGYGVVSGSATFLDIARMQGSILKIACEDEAKAKLVQAKYLSDLQVLPGVRTIRLPCKGGPIPAFAIDNQGVVLAAREGATVTVLVAGSREGLAALVAEVFPTVHKSVSFAPETAVPMYLNRWDKHGMNFYYAPYHSPNGPDGKPVKNYDPSHDFDFAHKEGDCGLVAWGGGYPLDTAEGMMRTTQWDWVVRACQKWGLPLGINTDGGVSCSIFNRYRGQMFQQEPEYLGSTYRLFWPESVGRLSWNGLEAREVTLAMTQQTVRQFKDVDNVMGWLEPNGEMGHPDTDNLTEYGPYADRSYSEFLKSKYVTVQTVAQRWFGNEKALHSWEEVHVPELASFLGWGKDAVDLTGTWRISHDAPYGQASAAPGFDDSHWPTLTAPGHAIAILLPNKPAVLRRHITIDPSWLRANPKVWLYVWDLSDTRRTKDSKGPTDTLAFLNGVALTEAEPAQPHTSGHWAAYDVSSVLKSGDNTVAVDVPQGFFNYRVYFSPHQPRSYPDLGPQLNAQWADFVDWGSWMRTRCVRRGAQMIRQADPNRPIVFMSPDVYSADIKQVCEDYGGHFHNTGYMGGFWADFHCMEMGSADLPTDLEPGGPAKDVAGFKKCLGLWSTEGIQGIDYFLHIGDVEWNDEIRNCFHETINLWHLIGKYHIPKAQIALLASDRVARLTGNFPWHPDQKRFPLGGHWAVRLNELLTAEYPREEVCEQDFDRGHTDAYKVIIDTSTSVLDDGFLAKIEKWVKAGGIFVTYGQTGRHTSTEMDAWPISKLSGYAVLADNNPSRIVRVIQGQPVLSGQDQWNYKPAIGLTLKKQQPDCTDLMRWNDGTVAVGMRPMGKGFIIQTGARFQGPDTLHFFQSILDWARIEHVPAVAEGVIMRHFVSNNGLYDVWAMWNQKTSAVKTELVYRNGLRPAAAMDVKTGKPVALQQANGAEKIDLVFEPLETRVVLTPRSDLAASPAKWFVLQRNWWRGANGDLGPAIAPFQPKLALNLLNDWAFKPLPGATASSEGAALVCSDVDDSSWEKRSLGIFSIPDHPGLQHGVFRKHFTIPDGWTGGHVSLWVQERWAGPHPNKGRTYLDGKLIVEPTPADAAKKSDMPDLDSCVTANEVGGALKAGSAHILAIESCGDGPLVGSPADAWVAYRPDAASSVDLSGQWTAATDYLTYGNPLPIPGSYKGTALRRTVNVDAGRSAQNAVIRVEATDRSLHGVIVNGTWVLREPGFFGNVIDLNITPYVKFGQDNEIIVIGNGGKHTVKQVSLDFFDKGVYP